MTAIASIEVGTHTARLLVARLVDKGSRIEPLLRDRRTIRLADGFGTRRTGAIQREAFSRASDAIRDFARLVREAGGEIVQAVSTGVTRTAANRTAFLQRIAADSGVTIRCISGDEEARITSRGVAHALGPLRGPHVLFDLGGGSTEFVLGCGSSENETVVRSLPLGALVLKEAFLPTDPPAQAALQAMAAHIDGVLSRGLPRPKCHETPLRLIGTGGTVTTLAAMAHGLDTCEITPERMNGLSLNHSDLEDLFERMVRLPTARRACLKGLDAGRADVIPAGTLAVLRVMHHYGAEELSVSLSDILEGLLIAYVEGEEYD